MCYDLGCAYYARVTAEPMEEVSRLARLCEVCGKSVQKGMAVSHSHIRTKRSWSPNIQRVRALVDGKPARVYVCTRCLRAGRVKRAV